MAEEAAAYYGKFATPVVLTGKEAAVQNLVLPILDGPALASYAKEATYLSPIHCRICLQDCENLAAGADDVNGSSDTSNGLRVCPKNHEGESEATDGSSYRLRACPESYVGSAVAAAPDGDGITLESRTLFEELFGDPALPEDEEPAADATTNLTAVSRASTHAPAPVTGVDARVAYHVWRAHGMTPQEYRHHVHGREMAAGPQPITAQILRTRVSAFAEELKDVPPALRMYIYQSHDNYSKFVCGFSHHNKLTLGPLPYQF